ncbi:MAG: CBS domain-containing protein [Myxococcota bacterium]
MERKLADVLAETKRPVVTTSPSSNLREAAETLCENGIGALLVMEGGDVKGIVSERDIMRQVAAGADPGTTHVADAMTRDLVVGLEDDTLGYTMNVMTERRIRHLPVMRDNEVVGMISIGDVVNNVRVEDEIEIRMLNDYIHRVYPH